MPKRNIGNPFHEMASRCILNIWLYPLTRESLTPNIFFRSNAEKVIRRMQKGRGEQQNPQKDIPCLEGNVSTRWIFDAQTQHPEPFSRDGF